MLFVTCYLLTNDDILDTELDAIFVPDDDFLPNELNNADKTHSNRKKPIEPAIT